MRIRSLVLAAASALALPVVSASAQQNSAPKQVLSIQPLSAMLTVYAGEYERRLGQASTLGVGGTYWSEGNEALDASYTSGDLKFRYYPSGQALFGFSLGLSAGYTSASGSRSGAEATTGGPTFGTLLEYQWMMGARQNVSVVLGAGAKMLMVNEDEVENLTLRYPTARVSIGYGF